MAKWNEGIQLGSLPGLMRDGDCVDGTLQEGCRTPVVAVWNGHCREDDAPCHTRDIVGGRANRKGFRLEL